MMDKKYQSVKVNYFGEECNLSVTMRYEDFNARKRHTFVSVSSPWNPEDKLIDGFTRQPEMSRKGDDPANDKLWRRYNKAEVKMMQEVINIAVHNNLFPANTAKGLKYSRTYLCSCGCSPGFVSRDYGRKIYWISIKSPSKELEKAKRNAEYLSNREQQTMESVVI